MTILLDTSVLIDILNRRGGRSEFFRQLLQEGHAFACCAITIAEVYAGMRPHERSATEELLGGFEYYETFRTTAERAGRSKGTSARKGHTLGLPDALIAALALENGLTLATDNCKHFPMAELKLLALPALHYKHYMARYRSFRDFDWPLLAVALIICALGVLQIYSATHDTRWQDAWWKQIIWIAIAMGLMWIASSIDYHTLLAQVPLMYGLSIGSLIAVLAVGRLVFGSRRWIRVFWFNFQISEFVKLVIILMVARYLSELKSDRVRARDLLKLGGLVGIPVALVMYQPDLGTGLTYLPILAAGILIAGIRWHYLAAIALVGALALPVGWLFLKDYQRTRLETFVEPSRDPRGAR
jgi:predicted nucleic acid-binding protein